MVKLKLAAIALLMIAGCAFVICSRAQNLVTAAPPMQETKIQGWTMEDRQTFYHTAQGTRFFPYKWLLALEAPGKWTQEPFLTEERFRKYRLIPDTNTLNNPDQLPVGMAKEVAPDGEFVSITCSACHTGQIKFNDKLIRIDGGPAMHDVSGFIVSAYGGLADTYVRPKILLVQVADQTESIAKQKPEETPFAQPANNFPKEFSEADRARLRVGIIAAIRDQVLPTYQKFLTFVRDEYAPAGRNDIGLWSLPQGAERYALAVKRQTTTNMQPEEIHQLGLREVARIEAEQTVIAKQLGFANLKSFKESLKTNPDVHAKSRQQILDEYRTYTDQMWKRLPEMFGRLPKAKLEILPVEAFREKTASTSYNQGTPDGSRPGHVFVNTYDYENQLTINNEDTAYHEGVPGHHMQGSIAQELPELPPFRQQAGYTAYVEGWALYCEFLGKEMGFYQNPYNNYGRLDDEMWRAARLVVDTGIHYKKWTREQVVQYLRDHSSQNEAYFQSETDRYIAWPGQALAYKIGQLTILRLREKARAEHLIVKITDIELWSQLGAGALPMDVFEQRINSWIERVKRGETKKANS